MSIIIFILSILIIILLTRTNRNHCQSFKSQKQSTKENENKLPEKLFSIQTEYSFEPISKNPYSSVNSLPPLVLPTPSPPLPIIPTITPKPLSVRRLYKSYV